MPLFISWSVTIFSLEFSGFTSSACRFIGRVLVPYSYRKKPQRHHKSSPSGLLFLFLPIKALRILLADFHLLIHGFMWIVEA